MLLDLANNVGTPTGMQLRTKRDGDTEKLKMSNLPCSRRLLN